MQNSSSIRFRRVAQPQAALDAWLRQAPGEPLLILAFDFAEPWRQDSEELWLVVCRGADGGHGFSIVNPHRHALHSAIGREGARKTGVEAEETDALLEVRQAPQHWLDELLARGDAPRLALGRPLRLQPIAIAKPWGQEIWYTGIEQRGVSLVGDGQRWLPLSWLLAALPELYGARPPVLLKILDPLPDELFGDLYFELHQEKREVYVVTGVDRSAWPDGVGAIRYGFDPAVRAGYASDEAFRRDYLGAVADYRRVRLEIDRLLDRRRTEQGIALDAPLPAGRMQQWLEELPAPLRERELELRHVMERYTRLRPLRVGDVVKVPLLTPHSLQHGVRTVEFQTPVYERLILSFGQKVLTQAHWDTERAAELMRLDPAEDEPSPVVRRSGAWQEQKIVDFPDFEARRLEFAGADHCELPHLGAGGVAMAVTGSLRLDGMLLEPEQAALLPLGSRAEVTADAAACLLWAQPRDTAGPVE